MRDVVFQHSASGDFERGTGTRRAADGDSAGRTTGSQQNADPGSNPKAGTGGAVSMIPRKGAEVAKISKKVSVMCWKFGALEELAIELACRRMSGEGDPAAGGSSTRF